MHGDTIDSSGSDRAGSYDASARPARTVLVLGGGGSLGAFQAGALLALLEAGIVPDALAGCSAGALNAAFLAAEPTVRRARALAGFWADPTTQRVLSPSTWGRLRGMAGALTTRGDALLDAGPLRRLVAAQVTAHDVSELAVPLHITTTCLDCGEAVHHGAGPLGDALLASCALPGLLPPVRLACGVGSGTAHRHVDGGVLCGVPVQAALDRAGPADRILVLDCGLAPTTGAAGSCAALPDAQGCCGLAAPPAESVRGYRAPEEETRGVLDVVLRAFAVARAAANRASVAAAVADPRVRVLPHVADAWAAGMLPSLPQGPRDFAGTVELLAAGERSAQVWLDAGGLYELAGHPATARTAPAA